eukprot:scaffold6870_cov121-Cylindrotheca_fusiformis.AAC.13
MSNAAELKDIENVSETSETDGAKSESSEPKMTAKETMPSPTSSTGSNLRDTRLTVHVENAGSQQRRLPGMNYRVKWALVPTFCIILLAAAMSLSAYFAGWLNIPGLNSEIDRLEDEVDRLTLEVNKLQEENARYQLLNNELNSTVTDLRELIGVDLVEATTRLKQANEDLSETNAALVQQIQDLSDQSQEYQDLNDELNQTSIELRDQLDTFRTAIGDLVKHTAEVYNLADTLTNVTVDFEQIGQNQEMTLLATQVVFDEINGINNNLKALNDDLVSVVSFLEDTSAGLDSSLQETTEFLANQVDSANQRALNSLQSEYRTRIIRWDCDYRDYFREYSWGDDYDDTIPSSELDVALDYVGQQVLDELCLSRNDFEEYLRNNYSAITSNRIISAVTVYTDKGMEWLFDLDVKQWEDAGFNCENLGVQFEIASS